MKLARLLFLGALVLSSALIVRADGISPIDPTIIIGRGTGSAPITALQFPVPIGSNGGGIFYFDNATGQNWIGLTLTVTFKDANAAMAAAVSCSNGSILSDVFSACSSKRQGKILTISLTGGQITPCVGESCSLTSEFFVDLNDGATLHNHGKANGKGGWKGDTIQAQAITPEPATLLLLLSGLGGIWMCRKRG